MEENAPNTAGQTAKKFNVGCIVAPLVLIGVVGLFLLLYYLGRPEATGSISIQGSGAPPWSMPLTACHTRQDLAPVRDDGGPNAYKSRVLNDDIQSSAGLQILRNNLIKFFADDDIKILRGPRENPTPEDRQALIQFIKEGWHIQLVTNQFPPIDIVPEMCTRFMIEMQLAASNNLPKDVDGVIDLECTLADGRVLKAFAEFDQCG